jgi:hypothetical protein
VGNLACVLSKEHIFFFWPGTERRAVPDLEASSPITRRNSSPDPIWVRLSMTVPILLCALFVIVSQQYSATEKNWAYGSAGTILGYWLRK